MFAAGALSVTRSGSANTGCDSVKPLACTNVGRIAGVFRPAAGLALRTRPVASAKIPVRRNVCLGRFNQLRVGRRGPDEEENSALKRVARPEKTPEKPTLRVLPT
jgi:hypothetical protein